MIKLSSILNEIQVEKPPKIYRAVQVHDIEIPGVDDISGHLGDGYGEIVYLSHIEDWIDEEEDEENEEPSPEHLEALNKIKEYMLHHKINIILVPEYL